MAHELYFISSLSRAIAQTERAAAIRDALKGIEQLGCQPGYEQGFAQFRRFMKEVVRQAGELQKEADAADFVNAVADSLDPGLRGQPETSEVNALPPSSAARSAYGRFFAALDAAVDWDAVPYLTVRRNKQIVGTITMNGVADTVRLEGIEPGRYGFELCTGRDVWEGDLSDNDLLASSARQGRPLRLAAATSEHPDEPTREISLLGGEVMIRVFAGLEAGRIEIVFCTAGRV